MYIKKSIFYLIFLTGIFSLSASLKQDALDKVAIYLNGKLTGTWRADESEVIHITNIAENDTLVFRVRSDIGGLGNSSIDIKDNSGVPIENIINPASTNYSADFQYIVHFKKIDTNKVSSIQAFLNVDPARNVPPPTIASISFLKK